MSKPFPKMTGRCFCGQTKYRLQTAPLFCYACHCSDCHKHTGSAFALYTSIEADYVTSVGVIPPRITRSVRPSGSIRAAASCAKCGTQLWASGDTNPVIVDVKAGTLDFPELFEPDLHEFIDCKLPWVILPPGAKTCKGPFDFRKVWPKSSMQRFEAAVKRHEERLTKKKAEVDSAEENEDDKETDKTPTAESPEEKEDDEEFEKRYKETEKALQERLEKLSLKLKETEAA